jgi:hypothetical protein
MDEFSLTGEQILWILFAVASLVVAFFYCQNRWQAFRPMLEVKSEAVQKLTRPGLLQRQFAEKRWNEVFLTTLDRARQGFENVEGEAAAAVASALNEVERARSSLANLIRPVALQAVSSGELSSVVVRVDPGLLVYALAVPGRADDPRAIRRCSSLADGWKAHAQKVRRAASTPEQTPALLGLAYCFDPEAEGCTLAVAFEGNGQSLVSAPLADGSLAGSETVGRYHFSVSDSSKGKD